jgi:tetratricopeptide (TPR) repeat protein
MIAISTLVALTAALSTTSLAAPDFDQLLQKGHAAFLAYDLSSAEQAYAAACPAEYAQTQSPSQLAFCEHAWGTIADLRANSEDAVRHYTKALALWEALGNEYQTHRITTLTSLGSAYRRQGRVTDAERVLSEAFTLVKPLAGSDPELYGVVLSRWGALCGEPDKARIRLSEAIEVLRRLQEPNPRELALAYNALGMVDINTGHYKTGESELRRAVDLAGASVGENHPETAGYSANLALALMAEGEFNRAETLLRRARFVIESRDGTGSPQLVNILTGLISVEAALGKFGVAEDCGLKAVAILRQHAGNSATGNRGEIALVEVTLGGLYLRQGKTAEAEAILPAAIDEERGLLKAGRRLADGIRALAMLRADQQAWGQAESLYAEALGMYEAALGRNHADIAPVLREYAVILKRERAPKSRVRELEARARAIDHAADHTGSRA